MKYVVSEEIHGKKLLDFLQEKYPGVSIREIKGWLQSKCCLIGGRVELFSSRKLAFGDEVEIFLPQNLCSPGVVILWEDEHLAIVNKSWGVICTNEELWGCLGKKSELWKLVHRLDKDTSGLMLVAKHEEALEKLEKLFRLRSIEKRYLALVVGYVASKEGCLDTRFTKKGAYQGQTLYGSSPHGDKRAITYFRRLDANDRASLLLCEIATGRTHQIRIHMSEMGHPLLGEGQYARGKNTMPIPCSRHLLHARSLCFLHPFTGKELYKEAPLPEDFSKALQQLDLKLPTLHAS